MGRNMSSVGKIEEERIQCVSISIEELDTLDEYESHEQIELKVITYLEQHPDLDVKRCGEILRKIDQKQDKEVEFLRVSEKKQILGHGGSLEILEGREEYETATAGSPRNPKDPYRKNTQTLF